MQRLLISAVFIGITLCSAHAATKAPTAATASANCPLELSVDDPHGKRTSLRVTPSADGVQVDYWFIEGGQKISQSRHFSAEILEDIRKRWGAPVFDVKSWHSELGCQGMMTWVARTGGASRVICRDANHLDRVADFQSMIQLIMQARTSNPAEQPKVEELADAKHAPSGETSEAKAAAGNKQLQKPAR